MKRPHPLSADKKLGEVVGPQVEFAAEVLQQIRQHARSSMRAEICGILIGDVDGCKTRVWARIPGEGAAQGGAHVTFTQDAWEHIFKIKDKEFPEAMIVGWYHSHPGFGIFLSDYDLFIHGNFFNAPHQIAWVYDPHSDEEGCFGWAASKVEPVEEIVIVSKQSSAGAVLSEEKMADEADVSTGSMKNGGRERVLGLLIVALLAFAMGYVVRPYVDSLTSKEKSVPQRSMHRSLQQ